MKSLKSKQIKKQTTRNHRKHKYTMNHNHNGGGFGFKNWLRTKKLKTKKWLRTKKMTARSKFLSAKSKFLRTKRNFSIRRFLRRRPRSNYIQLNEIKSESYHHPHHHQKNSSHRIGSNQVYLTNAPVSLQTLLTTKTNPKLNSTTKMYKESLERIQLLEELIERESNAGHNVSSFIRKRDGIIDMLNSRRKGANLSRINNNLKIYNPSLRMHNSNSYA
jgi:hypothetical protein